MSKESPITALSKAERIDALCDQFEAEWQGGQKPRLEDWCDQAGDVPRAELFRALLGVEIELRLKARDKVRSSDYENRFPDFQKDVRDVFREIQQAQRDSQGKSKTVAGTVSVSNPAADTSVSDSKAATMPLAPFPSSLARFEIREVLGAGAFGTVYKARDPKLDRDVAIKVPKESNLKTNDDRARFLREARAAANLSHPNICPVHEVCDVEGQDYIVMGYIEGKPLSALVATGKIQPRQAAICTLKLARAFQEAHDKGILHRDIKPANIMINRKGEPIVMDFGLARLHRPGDAQITQSGQIMGSPAYMSPEQARGAASEIGPTADVYSLGVVLYEMLCGKRPFVGTVTEVLGQILHVPAPPPSQHKPGLDPALEAICLKAMAKNPAERFPSMKAFAQVLTEYLKGAQAGVTTRAGTDSGTIDDEIGQETRMSEMFAALAAEQRSLTRHAVQEAVQQGAKSARPNWPILLGASALAALILFLGIWFFVRKDTVTVVIQIPIDTSNPALSFLLNDQPLEAEALAGPIELKPGDYELVVNRDGKLFKKFFFSVGKEDTGPVIVKDITPPPPPPPPPTVPASPLDRLDPTRIPVAARFPWHPPELVAVYGDHRGTHGAAIASLALSPDGKILASASYDYTIGLWDANTLNSVGRLAPLLGPIQCVAFTPSGKELLSAEANGVVRVWNMEDRREIGKFAGHQGPVHSVVVLPDGTRALSSGEDASIRLWEISTGKELKKFDKHTKAVWKLCLTADGKRVLSGSDDRTMRFWDVETGEDVVAFEEFNAGGYWNPFRAIALSPDGTRAACGHSEGQMNFATMRLFDATTGKQIHRSKNDVKNEDGHGFDGLNHPASLVFSPDGRLLLGGATSPADGNALLLWDGKTGAFQRKFAEQAAGATAVVLSQDGKRIYSGTWLGRIRMWDAETGKAVLPPLGHESFVSSVDLAPDGLSLLSGGEDLSVRLWNTLTGEQDVFRPTKPGTTYSAPWNAYFAPNGKTAVLYGGIYTVDHARLWDKETLTELRSFQQDWNEAVYCAAISPNSEQVLAGLHGGLHLWDSKRPTEPKRLAGHVGPCGSVAFFPDGKRAVSGGEDKFVRIWDLDTGEELKRIGPLLGRIRCKVSPDGKWIAVSFLDHSSVRLYRVEDLTEFDLGEHLGSAIAFSPDSKTLVTGSVSGHIQFWDVATRKRHRDINLVHVTGEIRDLDFDSTGRYLATANANGTVYLLRLEPIPNPPDTNKRPWKQPMELPQPVAHWNFDEADPTKFIDVMGTIPDGRAGGLRRKAGVIGKAMVLDGSEPFVPLGPGDQPKIVFASQMSLAVWVKPKAGASGAVIRRNAGYKLAWQNNEILFELVLVDKSKGWSMRLPVSAPAAADRWTHVAAVFDGDRVSLYLDGRLAQSRRVSEDPKVVNNPKMKDVKPPYVMFGVDPGWPNDVGGGYAGMADDLMLFDTALSPQQAEVLASSYQGIDDKVQTQGHAKTAQGAESQDGFISLFNGKDLSGWKTHPKQPGGWTVEDGLLTGRGNAPLHLFSERGDFSDLHLRAEVRINEAGNSGIYFRGAFDLSRQANFGLAPDGYETQIFHPSHNPGGALTGSLWGAGTVLQAFGEPLAKPDEWFTLEIIAKGNRLVTKVNGQKTANVEDAQYRRGHIALQCYSVNTLVQFRKIEVKELPSSAP